MKMSKMMMTALLALKEAKPKLSLVAWSRRDRGELSRARLLGREAARSVDGRRVDAERGASWATC